MKYLLFILLLAHLPLAWSESHGKSSTPQAEGLFRLAGSNTVGGQLAPAWCKAFLQQKGISNVSVIKLDVENEYRIQGLSQGKKIYIDVAAHGSSTGFQALLKGSADIAMSSRLIKDSERVVLSAMRNHSTSVSEHVVAIDGLSIIVNPKNKIQNLSILQVAQVFSGGVSNWQSLGGDDRPIQVLARDERSGTWDTFESLVLQKTRSLVGAAQRFEGNAELAKTVASNPDAIGFVALGAWEGVKTLAIGGVTSSLLPSKLLVATEDYPLSRRLFLYAPEVSANANVAEFVDFVQHNTAQQLVEKVGFVSLNPIKMKSRLSSGPQPYQDLSRKAERLSVNFRFLAGSAELDNKAKRDVRRLGDYFNHPDNKDKRIQLVGFSESKNNSSMTNILSKLRATAVKMELYKYGVMTESVLGFGESLPVFTEDGEGLNKNNRVEVWVY